MKRIILIMLSIAAAGTFVVLQAQEDTNTPDCNHSETAEAECCCNGITEGCMADCDNCDECTCESDDCTVDDSSCDDCVPEKVEVIRHCGGCR